MEGAQTAMAHTRGHAGLHLTARRPRSNIPPSSAATSCRVEKVGALTCFSGTVTRTSEVRPELFLGAFRCLQCSTIVRGVEQQFKYTEPLICSNATCGNRCSPAGVRCMGLWVG